MPLTFTLPQAVLIAVSLLVFSCVLKSTVGSCPEGYSCHLEQDTYVLERALLVDNQQLNVEDVPANATHLKITCTDRRPPVTLTFKNLPNIQKLTLDNLDIATWDEDMFQGVTNISHLIMNKLSCKRFEKNSFNGLTNLRSLEIEHLDELKYMHSEMLTPLVSLQSLSFRYVGSKYDALNYSDYGRVLEGINSSSTLHKLVLYAIHSVLHKENGLVLTDLFRNGSVGYSVKHLDIGRNGLDYIWGSVVTTLPMLQYISLSENVIIGSRGSQNLSIFWAYLFQHPRLETIDIIGMNPTTNVLREIHFNLDADEDCSQSLNLTMGAKLRSISLTNSTFYSNSLISAIRFCLLDPHQSLKYIDASNMRSTIPSVASLAGIRSLEYMNVQNYNFRGIPVDLFHKLPNLTMLLLGENDIGNIIATDTENRMFHNNKRLLTLDLAACHLTHIRPRQFSNLRQLQHLNLSRNALSHFHIDLNDTKRLRHLDLSDNKLSALSVSTRSALDEMAAVKVDISGNPLLCVCNNTGFVTWTHTTKVTFLNKLHTFCIDKDNSTNLLFYFDSEALVDACRPPNTGWYLTVLLPIGVAFIVTVVLISVVCRYRWKCAYCCSRMHVHSPSSGDKLDHVVYERDAFICYNSSDRAWVCNELLTRLENSNVSTIIHQRDFLPGSVVHESILESIDKCRYTVLVFSPDFLGSDWCLVETHLARNRIITHGLDVIVPIILREFPMETLSRTLVGILEKSYLKWSDNPDEQVDFWDKLVTKLKQGGNIKPLEM